MAHCSSPSSKKGFCPFSLFLFAGTAIATVRYLRRAVVPAADEKEAAPTAASPDESVVPGPPPMTWRVVFVLGGPGAALFIQWAWAGLVPHYPMPNEAALFLAGVISTTAGTFLPQAFGRTE